MNGDESQNIRVNDQNLLIFFRIELTREWKWIPKFTRERETMPPFCVTVGARLRLKIISKNQKVFTQNRVQA